LERTAMFSMKVFGPKVYTWWIGGLVALARELARQNRGRRSGLYVNIFGELFSKIADRFSAIFKSVQDRT
jgi:hypothetical protein